MAAVDKIFGRKEQRDEFYNWCRENKPEICKLFYTWDDKKGKVQTLTNLPEELDMWLLENCTIKFVTNRIKEQYDLEDGGEAEA